MCRAAARMRKRGRATPATVTWKRCSSGVRSAGAAELVRGRGSSRTRRTACSPAAARASMPTIPRSRTASSPRSSKEPNHCGGVIAQRLTQRRRREADASSLRRRKRRRLLRSVARSRTRSLDALRMRAGRAPRSVYRVPDDATYFDDARSNTKRALVQAMRCESASAEAKGPAAAAFVRIFGPTGYR